MGAACCGSTKQLKRKPAGSNNPSSEAINRAMAFEKRSVPILLDAARFFHLF